MTSKKEEKDSVVILEDTCVGDVLVRIVDPSEFVLVCAVGHGRRLMVWDDLSSGSWEDWVNLNGFERI